MMHQIVDNQCIKKKNKNSGKDRHQNKFEPDISHNSNQGSCTSGRMKSMSEVHTENR